MNISHNQASEKMKDVSLLISSCDKYEEIWLPFFSLLDKYWTDHPKPSYILTETKKCSYKDVVTLNSTKSWSDRLLYALEEIRTEYVIFFLDDFFLMDYVDRDELTRVYSIMKNNPDIAVFYFKHSTPQRSTKDEFNGYINMDISLKYIVNFQVGLWRTAALKQVIESGRSPWEIEENSAPSILPEWRFFCPIKGSFTNCKDDVFPYLWALEAGYGVCKGRMLWNNKNLFRKEHIKYTPIRLSYMSYYEYCMGKIKNYLKAKLHK